MLRKFTAFVPRYRKFESISLQRRVQCEPAADRPRWGRAAGSNTLAVPGSDGSGPMGSHAVAPSDCTQGVSAKADFGLWV